MSTGKFYHESKVKEGYPQINVSACEVTIPINIVSQVANLEVDIVAQSVGEIAVDIAAQSTGPIAVSINAVDIHGDIPISIDADNITGNIPIDITAQTMGNIQVDIFAQSIGPIQIGINAINIEGNIPIDIAAQSMGDISIDIAAQSLGTIAISLSSDDVIGSIPIDIAAQTIGEIGVDIVSQSVGAIGIDIVSQSVGVLAISLNAGDVIGSIPIDIVTQSVGILQVDIAAQSIEGMNFNIASQSVVLSITIQGQATGLLSITDWATQEANDFHIQGEAEDVGDGDTETLITLPLVTTLEHWLYTVHVSGTQPGLARVRCDRDEGPPIEYDELAYGYFPAGSGFIKNWLAPVKRRAEPPDITEITVEITNLGSVNGNFGATLDGLTVVDLSAQEETYEDEADWAACAVQEDIDTSSSPGDVILEIEP